MNEVGNNTIYNRLCNYQAYLRYVLIKTAAESTDSIRFDEICKKIEGNSNKLLEGLDISFIPLLKNYPNLVNSCLRDVLPLAIATSALHKVTQEYISYCFSKGNSEYTVKSQNLISKQKLFISAKDEYEKATGRKLGSEFVSVLKELAYCQAKEKESLIAKMYSDLSELLTADSRSSMSPVNDGLLVDNLPDRIKIGTINNPCEISASNLVELDIDEIISSCGKRDLFVNIRENGNLVINAPRGSERDDALYDYICNIVISYIQAFPIGALRVHFVDSQRDMRFEKFVSGLRTRVGNNGDKETGREAYFIEVLNSYDPLVERLNHKCEDITANLVGDIKNYYDLYKITPEEYIDLVVIRNGFNEYAKGSSSANNVFDHIERNIYSDSRGHRCGIRYIIVNDINYEESRFEEGLKLKMNTVLNEVGLVIDYKDGKFFFKKNGNENINISPLFAPSNCSEEGFIEQISGKLGFELKNKAVRKIDYSELGCVDIYDKCTLPALTIPVGKDGSKIVNIPLSCNDKDDTAEGKSVGLMVLGRTGTGKSSLFHSIIMNGALKYSPKELQFWLMDFKDNAAVKTYFLKERNIPHIKIIAPDSKIDDAFVILRMLEDERGVRQKKFGELSSRYGVDIKDISQYNNYIDENDLDIPHLPRIVLMIDEAQLLFGNYAGGDEAGELSKKIINFLNGMIGLVRTSGIHIIMFAQDLTTGKSSSIASSFVAQRISKVCFGLGPSNVTNSNYGEQFTSRKEEIAALGTGEAYIAYPEGALKKMKVAFVDEVRQSEYIDVIINKYKDVQTETLKIGNSADLKCTDKIPRSDITYLDKVMSPSIREKDGYKRFYFVIGENSYTLAPTSLVFSQNKRSSAFLLGDSRRILNSILSSLLLGACRIDADIRVCSGKWRERSMFNELVKSGFNGVKYYGPQDFDGCIAETYIEYKNRKQNGDLGKPLFLILKDIEDIDSLRKNDKLKKEDDGNASDPPTTHEGYNSFFTAMAKPKKMLGQDILGDIRVRDAIEELIKRACEYNIYLVVNLPSDNDRDLGTLIQVLSDTTNFVVFNDLKNSNNAYATNRIVKEMLATIRAPKVISSVNDVYDDFDEEEDREKFALLRRADDPEKIRPIIFDMSADFENIKKRLEEQL